MPGPVPPRSPRTAREVRDLGSEDEHSMCRSSQPPPALFMLESYGLPTPPVLSRSRLALEVAPSRPARLGSGRVEIMDIGMRSIGAEGAGRAGALLAGLFSLFMLVSMIAGLRYGSMVFALVVPLVMMREKARRIGSLIATALVGGFTVVVLDNLAAVAWPDSHSRIKGRACAPTDPVLPSVRSPHRSALQTRVFRGATPTSLPRYVHIR